MFTYWYERDALFDFIKKEKLSGVVLLGGDIHVSRYLKHPNRIGYDLHDFIVSPGHLSVIPSLNVYHPELEWSVVKGNEFLTMTADTTAPDPVLTVRFRDGTGKVDKEIAVRASELSYHEEEGGINRGLRAKWDFEGGFKNRSTLGDRIDAKPVNGASLVKDGGVRGSGLRLEKGKKQYAVIERSFLDDQSDAHTVAFWCKTSSLPTHGSDRRDFLLESIAEGKVSPKMAIPLSLGLRTSAKDETKVNLQLYTQTLKPATGVNAAPTPLTQGPFDTDIARKQFEDGAWIVMTFDSHQLCLFVNGEKVSAHALPVKGPVAEFGGLVIGGHRAGEGRNFDGVIDEISIWGRVLSEEEIHKIGN